MAKRQLPSPEVLRQLLRYEPDTGKLFWKERGPEFFTHNGQERDALWSCRAWNSRFAGKEAFAIVDRQGYRVGRVCSVRLSAHRVIWAMEAGRWAEECIDHINGDKGDNRACNLREAGLSENRWNVGLSAANTSGFKGVSWSAARGKWQASIRKRGSRSHLGYFETPELAAAAYLEASKALHGQYACSGSSGRS